MVSPKKRPSILTGTTTKFTTGCGSIYVTINTCDGVPFEVFCTMGKAGGCASSQAQAMGRMISLALRSGIEIKPIVKQLKGISCHAGGWQPDSNILSCAGAIAKVLEMQDELPFNGEN